MAIPETKDNYKGRILPLPRGNEITVLMFGLCPATCWELVPPKSAQLEHGMDGLPHGSGLGQIPSPLVGHEVQEKDLKRFHSRLRQGQTHRCPGQIGMKVREIVHKSDGFTFSQLSTLKCRFQIQRHTGQIWRQTSKKRSESENFSPDLLFLDLSKIEHFSLRK